MAGDTLQHGPHGLSWRLIGWGAAGIVLLLPLLAGAPWTASDYVIMGLMLGTAGLMLELASRASGNLAYRAGAGLAVMAAFLLIWVNLAVGILGSEDNPANWLFAGLIALAAAGAAAARFRPAGMARAMTITAAVQIAIGIAALALPFGSPGRQGIYEAVMGTGLFATLWLLSAWLFRKAAVAA